MPKYSGGYPPPKLVHIKVQSVMHSHLHKDLNAPKTIGEYVDELLTQESRDVRFPNKVVIEINPPEHEPERCE